MHNLNEYLRQETTPQWEKSFERVCWLIIIIAVVYFAPVIWQIISR